MVVSQEFTTRLGGTDMVALLIFIGFVPGFVCGIWLCWSWHADPTPLETLQVVRRDADYEMWKREFEKERRKT